MASPFKPIQAQSTTGRPVTALTAMPSLGGKASPLPVEGVMSPARGAGATHGASAPKTFSQPSSGRSNFTQHEQRTGPVAHISMKPGKV